MSLDDDADDDADALRAPLPPDDRLWRHPSEIGVHGFGGAPVAAVPARGPRPRSGWTAVVVAGAAGAVLMVGILSVSGHLSGVVERPVVEKVALTPIVSTPMLKGDSGVAAVVRRTQRSIVRLELTPGDGVVPGPGTTTGSGVVFRDDGMVLTSAHLLAGATGITVRLHDGRRLVGTVVGVDEVTDVAVVDIEATGLPVAVLGTGRELELGAPTLAIGSAPGAGRSSSVATGVISGLRRTLDLTGGRWLHGLVETDAPVDAVCTGGALVDGAGAVIGIVTAFGAVDGDPAARSGFATPIDLAHRVALQLIESGHASHGWLGVEGEDLTPAEAASLGVPGGARVREVDDDGPAARAGLGHDDVITEIDGREVDSMPGLAVEVREHQPGDEVTVGYWRDGEHRAADVTVGERP